MNELDVSRFEKVRRQISRALGLQKSLGARCAAGYLRNQQYELNSALLILGFPIRSW